MAFQKKKIPLQARKTPTLKLKLLKERPGFEKFLIKNYVKL